MSASEQRKVHSVAKSFCITTMMNVPETMSREAFVEAVVEQYKTLCDEAIREQNRRARMAQP